MNYNNFDVICSFCGRDEKDIDRIIAGNSVFICNECVSICYTAISDETNKIDNLNFSEKDVSLDFGDSLIKDITPKVIHDYLDKYIIGQYEAKKSLSVAVYNHYKRINKTAEVTKNNQENEKEINFLNNDDVELSKSNILLLGPTGSGKTLFASTLARMLKVPFAVVDATNLTEAGYVGDDVENILLRLLQNADYNVKSAQKGIIYIDEIDKISRKSDNPSITRDVSGEGVQQALLKIIEGTVAYIPPQGGRKHPGQECLKINTSDILFICGGAFIGLDNIVTLRTEGNSIGFENANINNLKNKNEKNILHKVIHDDLVKFGLIPEMVGRLPILVALNELTQDDLKNVLVKPKNSLIKQYKKIFSYDNASLSFTDDALELIAKNAIATKIGARGLRFIMERILLDYMYETPSLKINENIDIEIDEKLIKNKLESM